MFANIKALWEKFIHLAGWKQILIVIAILLLLPIALIFILFLLGKKTSSPSISEHAVESLKKSSDKVIKQMENKDTILKAKTDTLEVEKQIIFAEVEKNIDANTIIEEEISNAETISELRAIAKRLRDDYSNTNS